MSEYTIFMLLFMIATAVAISVQRIKIPYSVSLVLTGLLLGILHAFKVPALTEDLLFSIFLPGLLFEAAFHIDFQKLWQNRITISSLAVPGVVISTVLITLLFTPVVSRFLNIHVFGWKNALVFGALISAIDPVAVIAIFKNMGVPQRLNLLLDGESLLNDGTAIVFFTLSLSLLTGEQVSAGGLFTDFLKIIGIGAAIGVGTGMAAVQIFKRLNEPTIEIALTTVVAYGSFLLAEHFNYSGVIAAVSAGLLCGNYATKVGMLPPTRIAVENYWKYVSFALNSIVFLLIGFEVQLQSLLNSWKAIVFAFLVITVGRSLVVGLVTLFMRNKREEIPWKWTIVMTWGGLRGALPMVLVLTIPTEIPMRDFLITITFGVVILSILLQGLTMPFLLKLLDMVKGSKESKEFETAKGRLHAANAALKELGHITDIHFARPEMIEDIRKEYQKKIEDSLNTINELSKNRKELETEEIQSILKNLLLTEKLNIIHAFQHGTISLDIQKELLSEIDAKLLSMENE